MADRFLRERLGINKPAPHTILPPFIEIFNEAAGPIRERLARLRADTTLTARAIGREVEQLSYQLAANDNFLTTLASWFMLDALHPEQMQSADKLKSDVLLQQNDIRETIRILTGKQATAPKPQPVISLDTPLSAAPGLMLILARQLAQEEITAYDAESLVNRTGAYPHEQTLFAMENHADYLTDVSETLSPILDRWEKEISTADELADFHACDYLFAHLARCLNRQLIAIEKLKPRTIAARIEALRPAEALNELAEALGKSKPHPDQSSH
jgi:hypothetical protein